MPSLHRSVFITFFSTNTFAVLQFGVTLVLARLLTPAEVGIFSITVMLTNVAAIFRDFGVSSYLQREKDLTQAKIRSALGFLLTSSWTIAVGIYLFSDIAAKFYGEPGIGLVMRVLALSFVLVPFASFFYALLARNLEAGKQAIVNGVGTLVYAVSCLSLAWAGMSYMALAWASVINIAATIITYLVLRPSHIPLRPSFDHWREIAQFGGGAIIGGLVDKVNLAIPDLLLGKLSGPHAVGLYSRAGGLVGIFTQIAGPTLNYNTVPFLARNHHEGRPLAPLMEKATAYLTAVAWPIFFCIALFPHEIIRVLYGVQWEAAAPIATALSIAAIWRTGSTLCGPALMAVGHPYLVGISALFNAGVRLALVFTLGGDDLVAFAIAIMLADIVTVVIPMWLMSVHLGFGVRMAMRAHWSSLRVCLPGVVLGILLKLLLPDTFSDVLVLLVLSAMTILAWLLAVVKLGHPIRGEFPAVLNRLLPSGLARRIIGFIQE